jgi:hypothetical protein
MTDLERINQHLRLEADRVQQNLMGVQADYRAWLKGRSRRARVDAMKRAAAALAAPIEAVELAFQEI